MTVDLWSRMFSFEDYGALLQLVQNSIIAGAVLGGFIGRSLGWYGEGEAAGFLMSFAGAVALLALYRMFIGRRQTLTP